ncbi:sugar porter family MFS transporter [Streptomyces sp. NBC_01478]|uniref:hypothetical protein n=1 Tax=Streptomyces sp. NBC_01478 TaxID=2903882 RepID=UPI002E329428|nr:hypothetical protein [Streptomyces sp. NBC_01478]
MESRQPDGPAPSEDPAPPDDPAPLEEPAPKYRTFRSRIGFLVRHFARRPLLLAGLLAWTGCAVFLGKLLPEPLAAVAWAVFYLLGMLLFYPGEIDE